MKKLIRFFYEYISKKFLRREFEKQKFESINERIIEYSFLFDVLKSTINKPKKILDVGSGKSPLPAILRLCGFNVKSIDNSKDYWKRSLFNKHYHIINDDITNSKLDEKFDMIICISTLEHIKDYIKAIKNMWKLLAPRGDLILTFPYNRENYVPNVYDLEECSIHPKEFICQLFSNKKIHEMTKQRFHILKEDRWKCFSGKYWRCGERYENPKHEPLFEDPDLICVWWKKQ